MELQTTEVTTLSHEFTLAEYARQEATKAESTLAEVAGSYRRVRSNLSAGKVQEAVEDLNQNRAAAEADVTAQAEFRALEEAVKKDQASNLIKAQRDYTFSNALKFGNAIQQGQAIQSAEYEDEIARQQVQALQKVQALGVSRQQPLRVNLPTRGLRHSFTQVLQTDVNKPMTVSFKAINTASTGWFKRSLLWIGGFLALWVVVGVVTAFRPARRLE
jgi:hypothetical protein